MNALNTLMCLHACSKFSRVTVSDNDRSKGQFYCSSCTSYFAIMLSVELTILNCSCSQC